jgi:hypothetical protein
VLPAGSPRPATLDKWRPRWHQSRDLHNTGPRA